MKGSLYISDTNSHQSPFASYHIYQRSIDKRVIFHNSYDALVLLTIISIRAKIHNIKIFALCFMSNHIHLLVKAKQKETIHKFVNEYTSFFSRFYNKEHERKGPLISRPFGRALKYTDKYIRNCISYICNNPVEARICKKIEQYTWNFVSYFKSSHPFSQKIDLSTSRNRLRISIRQIKSLYSKGKNLNYTLLRNLFSEINKEEALQLKDYIIKTYNPVDYQAAISLFGNWDQAILAINSYTGSEYDIKEDDRI